MNSEKLHDVAILGAGPAGLAAAIYTARSRLDTVVLDAQGGGGQLAIIDRIENYPGFDKAVTGMDLFEAMRRQAEGFGVQVAFEQAQKVEADGEGVTVIGDSGRHRARYLIVATGARHRELCIPSEERLKGRGVSYCATCDGNFFAAKPVAVVGGGDSAVKEAIYLSRIVEKVYLIHRRDRLRAEALLQERIRERPNVEFVWDSVVDEILGEDAVRGVRVKNIKTGAAREIPLEAVFVFVGILPNTDFLSGVVKLDEMGFVVADGRMRTSHPRIFACGDVRADSVRQIGVAVGDGITAAVTIQELLDTETPPRRCGPECDPAAGPAR